VRRRTASPVIAEADPLPDVVASSEGEDVVDPSAMADPENAHSPMSPDDQVSNQHTGLHNDEHSTTGHTPAS
jgi:hypothetical protein